MVGQAVEAEGCPLVITDPPYADAIHYHEITEFFIAWLRKNPRLPLTTGFGIVGVRLQLKGRATTFGGR